MIGLHRLVGLRQPDAAEGVGEVLGEMFPIGRLHSRTPLARLAKRPQQVETNGVQPAQVHDHFAQAQLGLRGQEVQAPDSPGPQRAPNFGCFEYPPIHQLLGVEHGRHDGIVYLLVGKVARLCQNEDSVVIQVDIFGIQLTGLKRTDRHDRASVNQIALVEWFVRRRCVVDHSGAKSDS